ncbi:hypothetical protein SRHO_G00010760 [Serrasalmus rhombeus]
MLYLGRGQPPAEALPVVSPPSGASDFCASSTLFNYYKLHWIVASSPAQCFSLRVRQHTFTFIGDPLAWIVLGCASSSLQCCCFEPWAEAGSRLIWVVESFSLVL